jgi:hypothetical protein
MNQTNEAKNKALVLEVFDTLFNKRDYATAERYWSPNYIQQMIWPGRPLALSALEMFDLALRKLGVRLAWASSHGALI